MNDKIFTDSNGRQYKIIATLDDIEKMEKEHLSQKMQTLLRRIAELEQKLEEKERQLKEKNDTST